MKTFSAVSKTNKRITIIALLFLSIFLINSCKSYVPYTKQLTTKNNWSNNDIQKIQFYLSNTIIMYRQMGESETTIESGKIKIVDGKEVEEIVIKKGTPGIVTDFGNKEKMAVSFEIDDGHFLTFGSYKNRGGIFYLMLESYKKNQSKVTYVGKKYFISPESLHSFLQVDMKKIKKEERKQRVAGGRKIN